MLFNCHSYFSLRYGTFAVDELVLEAKRMGWSKIALTDINNSSGMIDFVKACKTHGLDGAGGIEFRCKNQLLYIGLAKNNLGFQQLNEFLSEHNMSEKLLPERAPILSEVVFIYPLKNALMLESLRDDEFVGIRQNEQFKLPTLNFLPEKLLAWAPVTFKNDESYILHRHLRAIDNNTLLSKLKPEHLANDDETLFSPEQLQKTFQSYAFLFENSLNLLKNCSIDFDFKSVKNKKCYTDSQSGDFKLLRELAYQGMEYRYGMDNEIAKERVDKELGIIFTLGFASYFLITWDLITYSMSKGYYHVGRGSGANSVVAYCLKIVDVDPIELDLYFERFINPRRTSPPDFDIDYSWREREDVQRYIFSRYGKNHVALLGAMSTFVGKSIYRELGKVYGLPKEEIDDLIKYPHEDRNNNHLTRNMHRYASLMTGFPNVRSIHAGGILVSEEPITTYTALDMPPKGFPTTQWDMYVAEDIGFEKLDILSQRGIGHIKDAATYVLKNKGTEVDVHQVEKFKLDENVRRLLASGETIGCFYIESPAMRGLITKLRCNNYLTLVAASSIIRPGVASSGMMREYILRYNNPNSFQYIHPVMEQQLKETYGVMVYQEDVLKICHHFAGLDLGDADVLRRAMSGKTRSKDEFNRIVQRFFDNCKSYGYADEVAKEVWRQIESFAGYSFSKAHSASYAVESFQSLYLKTYFPHEFITAVINNFGGFYRSWLYFNEAKRLGAFVKNPDINKSEYLTNLQGNEIFVGFVHLLSFELRLANQIVKERAMNGLFESLEDFMARVPCGIEQLSILIRSGAFAFTQIPKPQLLWTAHFLLNKSSVQTQTSSLFKAESKSFHFPELQHEPITDAYDEIELFGFPICCSYFDLLITTYRGDCMAKQLPHFIGKQIRMLGHLVTIKYVKTKHNDYMHFATFVDAEGNLFDSVHFPDSLKNYPFRGDGIYLMLGKVVEEFGYASLQVEKLAKMPLKPNPVGS